MYRVERGGRERGERREMLACGDIDDKKIEKL
jgi:hypothetical protein